MSRQPLHDLIDRIPESELTAAQRFLEFLACNPTLRALIAVPADDEPLTVADVEGIRRAEADVQAGRVVSHEEILREFVRE